jgi:hypothetical protein
MWIRYGRGLRHVTEMRGTKYVLTSTHHKYFQAGLTDSCPLNTEDDNWSAASEGKTEITVVELHTRGPAS